MPRKSAKQLEREAKAAQRATERRKRLQQQKEEQQALMIQLQQREAERKSMAAAAALSSDQAEATEAAAAAPSGSSGAAAQRAQSSRGRKRPRQRSDGDDDEDEGDEAAAAAAPASHKRAGGASAESAPAKQPSRNSTRIVRRPGRPDDSSDEEEATSARKHANNNSNSSSNGKRARGSSAAAAAAALLPAPLDPDELADEWRCSANDALTFRLVRPPPEKDSSGPLETMNFHPHYTHQLWDDEEIVGYKRVKALVAFTSGALYTYLNVEYDLKCPDTDVADIATLIGSKLRGGFTRDYEDFKQHLHDSFVPPGTLMAEYTVPSVDHSFKETISYEVYRGGFSDPLMRAYHARLQFFLLFFIDRSSYINDSDPVWEVILLFQKRVTVLPGAGKGAAAAGCNGTVTTYHIVGYTTLYKFLSYPSDWKMRLSQILILPPYQRAGHGQKLLQLVYAEAEKRKMIEVNIEDPSPVFQMLRDLTDLNLCRKHRFYEKPPPTAGDEFDPLESWDADYASKVKSSLRITLAQVRRCYEIFKLNAVNDRHKNSKSMVAYRLEVKRRLFHEEREVLALYSQKPEERKEKLAEIYNELEQHYLAVIKKARLH